jgi:flavin reductase (DIM6/NTAB) family NADH-FMN oxidoreductase RutF
MKKDLALLFRQLTHGVYVIGVADNDQYNAFTAAWVMHVSFNPLILALSINPNHSSYAMLQKSKVFSVNVLGKDQLDLAEHFGKPSTSDKLVDIDWHCDQTGAPILDHALAYFECEVSHDCEAGDHMIIIGRVVNGAVINPDALPLLYRDTEEMNGSARLFPDAF